MALPRELLPDDIFWLADKVEQLVRPAAFILPSKDGSVAAQGSTHAWGRPDVPVDATWDSRSICSPHDGPCFWLQLNLAEIPESVRRPEWPAVGMVWLYLDLFGGWKVIVHYDPRPAREIVWQPRQAHQQPAAAQWLLEDTLPWCTEKTLPDIAWDWRDETGLVRQYTDWVSAQYHRRYPSDIQIGGWALPCQGDSDSRNEDFILSMSRQPFGDCGEVSLHYNQTMGFYAHVDCA